MNECPLKRDSFFPKEMNHRPVPSFFPENTPPKFNSSPLKNAGWKTTSLLGFGNFSGVNSLLNFGGGVFVSFQGVTRP